MDERMTRGWWRRNAVALAVVVVLAPTIAVAVTINAWSDVNAIAHVRVEPGTEAEFAGAGYSARAAFADDLEGTPRGARVVGVEIDIDPKGRAGSCMPRLLRERGGAQREWDDSTYGVRRPYDPDRITTCDSSRTSPYTVSLDYIVPADASGPFVLELSSEAGGRDVLELVVAP